VQARKETRTRIPAAGSPKHEKTRKGIDLAGPAVKRKKVMPYRKKGAMIFLEPIVEMIGIRLDVVPLA